MTDDRPTATIDEHATATPTTSPGAVVVMGVSGSGKTTVAQDLAERLGWRFTEGDDFHPQANVDKMAAGEPLDDDDREPWLEKIRDWLDEQAAQGEHAVVTCSALRRPYRDLLRSGRARVVFLHLTGSRALLAERMGRRSGHFMPTSLLDSQLDTLEPLEDDEAGAEVGIDRTPEQIVDEAVAALGLV